MDEKDLIYLGNPGGWISAQKIKEKGGVPIMTFIPESHLFCQRSFNNKTTNVD